MKQKNNVAQYVEEAELRLAENARLKTIIHEALNRRVRFAIAEMRKERASEALGDHLDLRRAALVAAEGAPLAGGVDEGWGDIGRTIGKSTLRFTGHLAAHGLGLTNKKPKSFSKVIKGKAIKSKKAKVGHVKPTKGDATVGKVGQKPRTTLS